MSTASRRGGIGPIAPEQSDGLATSRPTLPGETIFMKCGALSSLVLLGVAACATTSGTETPFAQPNAIMRAEIEHRVSQIPYQHREELFNNLLWLAQTGEQAIPSLLTGLGSGEAKVRSNCAWVLGRIGDRRVIPYLQNVANDAHEFVRLEAARSLVTMGDVKHAPTLIAGLDSEQVQVRYLCHEALKAATGRDFNYDHLSDDALARRQAAFRWRQWWSQQSGDSFFAAEYARQNGIDTQSGGTQWSQPMAAPPMPAGETAAPAPNSTATTSTTPPKAMTPPEGPVAPQAAPVAPPSGSAATPKAPNPTQDSDNTAPANHADDGVIVVPPRGSAGGANRGNG
jgi:hypothetical protein